MGIASCSCRGHVGVGLGVRPWSGSYCDRVEMFLNHRDLSLQDADVVATALVHFRKQPKLGFSDCLMLEVARKAGHLPLGTFDRELSKLDGAQRL